VPLNADVARVVDCIRSPNAFNQAVGSACPGLQACTQSVDALVMVRHHHGRISELDSSKWSFSQGVNGVEGVPGCSFRSGSMGVCTQNIWKMGVQGSAIVHVHELEPAANAEARQMERINGLQQITFNAVTFEVDGSTTQSVFGTSVATGVDVRATCHQHAVCFGQRNLPLRSGHRRRIVPCDNCGCCERVKKIFVRPAFKQPRSHDVQCVWC